MFRVFIIADDTEQVRKLGSGLAQRGITCSIASYDEEEVVEQVTGQSLDLVLIAIDGLPVTSGIWQLPQKIKQERSLPIIALLSREMLGSLDPGAGIDDFVVEPWEPPEVALRVKRILRQTRNIDDEDLIKRGDLVIDAAKCEVSVCGRLATLTFKEYELLRFLASNEGKVFTRDALLNEIWGYDYYGGDRTVDVHIRRLRTKIEAGEYSFIETVRNIGYKFRVDSHGKEA